MNGITNNLNRVMNGITSNLNRVISNLRGHPVPSQDRRLIPVIMVQQRPVVSGDQLQDQDAGIPPQGQDAGVPPQGQDAGVQQQVNESFQSFVNFFFEQSCDTFKIAARELLDPMFNLIRNFKEKLGSNLERRDFIRRENVSVKALAVIVAGIIPLVCCKTLRQVMSKIISFVFKTFSQVMSKIISFVFVEIMSSPLQVVTNVVCEYSKCILCKMWMYIAILFLVRAICHTDCGPTFTPIVSAFVPLVDRCSGLVAKCILAGGGILVALKLVSGLLARAAA
jgi:hypothetical protein